MTLGIYMDKSGPTEAIPAITVAGVIMDSESVGPFSEEWGAALHDFEELPYFHMTDYDSGTGLYETWNERGVKRERFSRFLDLIEKYVIGTISVSVSVGHCQAFYADKPLQVGYGITATHCFCLVPQFRYIAERPDERVSGSWPRAGFFCSIMQSGCSVARGLQSPALSRLAHEAASTVPHRAHARSRSGGGTERRGSVPPR